MLSGLYCLRSSKTQNLPPFLWYTRCLSFFLFELCHLKPLPRWWTCRNSGRLLPSSERARRSWWWHRLSPSMVSCRTLYAASGRVSGIRVASRCSYGNAEQSRMQSLPCCCRAAAAAALWGSWFNHALVSLFCKAIRSLWVVLNRNNLSIYIK